MEFKLDINTLIKAIDTRDFSFLENQEDDVRNAFTPMVAMRWLSNSVDPDLSEYMLMALNETVNKNFSDIITHPGLIYKLMASCGCGETSKRYWINMGKRSKNNELHNFLQEIYPHYNEDELDLVLRKFTCETFSEFVEGAGLCDDERVEKLKDEYRTFAGIPSPTEKKTRKTTKTKNTGRK